MAAAATRDTVGLFPCNLMSQSTILRLSDRELAHRNCASLLKMHSPRPAHRAANAVCPASRLPPAAAESSWPAGSACDNAAVGAACNATCAIGYDGAPSATCQIDGSWTAVSGTCTTTGEAQLPLLSRPVAAARHEPVVQPPPIPGVQRVGWQPVTAWALCVPHASASRSSSAQID